MKRAQSQIAVAIVCCLLGFLLAYQFKVLAKENAEETNYISNDVLAEIESLKKENPMDQLTETTEVSLDYEPELLYKNMVAAKAQWLYELEEWNDIITPERQKELYKEEKRSGTIVKEKKIGRNDPCPCGSGKKYKYCCGR